MHHQTYGVVITEGYPVVYGVVITENYQVVYGVVITESLPGTTVWKRSIVRTTPLTKCLEAYNSKKDGTKQTSVMHKKTRNGKFPTW